MTAVRELQDVIDSQDRIVVLTGAGISTESGIPDFRSPGGIWSRYKTVTIQEFLSSNDARKRYWQYKMETYRDFSRASPNSGHHALVKLERDNKLQILVTQNIDGLHQQAGNSADKVLELHGTERYVKCLTCEHRFDRDRIQERVESGEEVPICDSCGGWLKPATISFGQMLPEQVLKRAFLESEKCRAFLVIGSSLSVQPAAMLPEIAKDAGAWLGILNRDPTPLDQLADWVCHSGAGEILSQVIKP